MVTKCFVCGTDLHSKDHPYYRPLQTPVYGGISRVANLGVCMPCWDARKERVDSRDVVRPKLDDGSECGCSADIGRMDHWSLLKKMLGNDERDRKTALCAAFVMVLMMATCAFLLALISYSKDESRALRIEAIKRGFAEYKADYEGRTEWQWKPVQENSRNAENGGHHE